jgi:hypothetical protein
MKKRTQKADAEVLQAITNLDDETEWSDDELDSYLREKGVDPAQVISQVRTSIAAALQGSIRQESVGAPLGQQLPPIQSLAKEGEARRLSIVQLAEASKMSLRLFAKLESGMLRYASIPFEVFEDVGRAVGRTAQEIGEYMRLNRPDARGAHFRAGSAPVISAQVDFFEAVRQDDSLIPEHRDRFFALEEKYKRGVPEADEMRSSKGVSAMNEKDHRLIVNEGSPSSDKKVRDEVRGIADKFADAFKEMKRRGD